jgi:hypothetical protein
MSWWDRYRDELEREILALQAAGMQPRKDENAFAAGKAILHIRLTVLGSEVDGVIIYPDLYPYFRPVLQVHGLDGTLRHYDPGSGEVCLLTRGTQHWYPLTTAAEYIKEMLPHWEKAAVRSFCDSRLEGEDSQAEPASVYCPAIATQTVVMDSTWSIPREALSGTLKVALPKGRNSIAVTEPFTAWVTEISGDNKNADHYAALSEHLKRWVGARGYKKCIFPWVRLEKAPNGRTPEEVVNLLLQSGARQHVQKEINLLRSGLFGFSFPEEGPDGKKRDGWLFLAYHCLPQSKRKKLQPSLWVVRADYGGEEDLLQRIPEMAPLRRKTVVCVGLGCVGAPSAFAFARAGVGELRLLDGDLVSVGTGCRWPLGLSAAGMGKVKEVTRFISENYPLTKLGTAHFPPGVGQDFRIQIGQCDFGEDQWNILDRLLEGADLVYDATAEQGVNLLLCDLAMARNIPYVTASSRSGGWGGNVVRVRADGSGGCYCCYLHALHDHLIPGPPYDPIGDGLQPVGCGDVTFKAAGFDVEEVAIAGVRMAISTLCEGSPGGYPAMTKDVGILSLREEGVAIFPHWDVFSLQKHPECGRCNSHEPSMGTTNSSGENAAGS